MRSARAEGVRLRSSEEASGDEVVLSDTSEREVDVDRSSDEESELCDIIGWRWYKMEEGIRTGGGFGLRKVRGEGNRGAKQMSNVRRGRWVRLWGGEMAEISGPRKGGGEPGLSVALDRRGIGLWSPWTGEGAKEIVGCVPRRAR